METMPLSRRRPSSFPAGRPRRRWVKYTLVSVLLLLLALAAGSYGFARRSLPQVSGQLRLAGLSAPVTVYRDSWGVPHIEAKTARDLYMAQGFVTAQDRFWQMELNRRVAAGRLSEFGGPGRVTTDKFLRALQMRRAAERSVAALSPSALEALEAYAVGVNAYVEEATAAGKLPVEFTLTGITPEPWTTVDTASIGKLMAYDLGGNFRAEVYMYQLRQHLGDDLAKQLLPAYPSDGPTILKTTAAGDVPQRVATLPPDDSRLDLSSLLALDVWPDEFLGSNNWVVSGALSKSGKPLLANDPHLGVNLPAIWYQTHLVLDGEKEKMNVIGVTFAGVPGIVVGHNDKIAWGVTNTGPDVQDLYIEKRNPNNPNQFEFMGKWEDARIYNEVIKVKGQPDVLFPVVVTRHGPIVSEVVGSDKNRPKEALALKWTAHLPTTEMEAILGFNRSTNWQEFREALKYFQSPTQNFVFASVDGTIAYHAGGLVPTRAKGDGLVPVPGWTGEYEWSGYISFDNMPEVVNPKDGYIVTANHKVIDDAYPYLLSYTWAEPYRATRILEQIRGRTGLTAEHMKALQTDYADLRARALLPVLMPRLQKAQLTGAEVTARDLLKSWNQVDAVDQGGAFIFHLWWKHLNQQLYEPTMGADLFSRMADQGNVTAKILRDADKGAANTWLMKAGGLEKLVETSFQAAVAEAAKLQGGDPQKWNWGKFHRLTPQHTLGSIKPLNLLLNADDLAVGGSGVTVGAMSFDQKTGLVTSTAVWRQVVDLADLAGGSADVVTPGQSGHFLSDWYQSQQVMHNKGDLHPQLMVPDQYRKGQKLSLQP